MIDWKTLSHVEGKDEIYWVLGELKKDFKVEEILEGRIWVAHNYEPDTEGYCWLEFAFFEFGSGFCGEPEDNNHVEIVMRGSGPVGALRECRHTYWGDNEGYIFYPQKDEILAILKWLEKYYDLD